MLVTGVDDVVDSPVRSETHAATEVQDVVGSAVVLDVRDRVPEVLKPGCALAKPTESVFRLFELEGDVTLSRR